jgi:hypothetical protein
MLKSVQTVEIPSVEELEQLLQRSVIDGEFRNLLVSEPQVFGMGADGEKISLPVPVSQQDMSFVELGTDSNIFAPSNCRTTCVSGWTIRCDGTTY